MSRPLPAFLPPLLDFGQRAGRPALHVPAGPAVPTPPLPRLPQRRTVDVLYGFALLDRDGRIHARRVATSLGWPVGGRLTAASRGPAIAISPNPAGRLILNKAWHLRLPLALRASRHLAAGTGVLLAADPGRDELVVYSPAALDIMITGWIARGAGGGA